MDAGTVEGALVMRDMATQVIAHVEKSLLGLTETLAATGKAAERAGATVTQALGPKLKAIGTDLKSFGMTASLALTAPLVGAGVAAVGMAKNFETSMTKIETLAAVSREQVDAWKQSVLGLSGQIGKGPQELADALFAIASAGNRGAEALDILKQAGMASAIGLGRTETIARTLVGTMAAYKDSGLTAAQATNVLIATVQEGNVEADELAGTLGRVVGIAATAGVSFQELGGFLATFTRLGVDSAEAVTALRGLLSTLIKPTNQAREQLQALGTSVDELRTKVKEQGLTQTMIELADATRGNLDAIGEIIPNVRALAGFLGTAGVNAKDFAAVTKTVTAAMNNASFTSDKFARTSETVAQQWEKLKAKVQLAAVSIGGQLIPAAEGALNAIRPLADMLVTAANGFNALPAPVKSAALGLLALAAALGPIAYLVGNVTKAVGTLLGTQAIGGLIEKVGPRLASALGTLGTQIGAVGAAARGSALLLSGFTAAIAGIVVGAGIVLLVEWINRVRESYENLLKAGDLVGHAVKEQDQALAILGAHQKGLAGEQIKGAAVTMDMAKAWQMGAESGGHLADVAGQTAVTLANFGQSAKDLGASFKGNAGLTVQAAQALADAAGAASGGAIAFRATIGTTGAAAAKAGPQVRTMSDELRAAQATLAALTPGMRAEIEAGLKMGKGATDIAAAFAQVHPAVNLSAGAVELYKERLSGAKDATKAATKDLQEFNDTLRALNGGEATKAAALVSAALSQIQGGIASVGQAGLEQAQQAFDAYFATLRSGATANDVFVRQAEEVRKQLAGLSRDAAGARALVVKPWTDLAQKMVDTWQEMDAAAIRRVADAIAGVARQTEHASEVMERLEAVKEKVADDRWIRAMPVGWERLAEVALQYRDALAQISDFDLGPHAEEMRAAVTASFEGMVADASLSTQQIASVFGALAKRFPDLFPKGGLPIFGGVKPSGKTVAPGLLDYLQSGLAPDILGAVKGGGSVLRTAGAGIFGQLFKVTDKAKGIAGGAIGDLLKKGTDAIGGVLGKGVGKALGSAIPALGPLVGDALGALGGKLFGKLFGADAKQTKQLRADLLESAGGLEALQKQAAYAGVSIDKLMSTKKSKEFTAEVKKLEAAFKATQERVKTLVADMDAIVAKGGIIPVDLWKRILSDKDKDEIKAELGKIFDQAVDQAARGFNRIAQNLLALTTLPTDQIKLITDEIARAREEGRKPVFSADFLGAVPVLLEKIGPLAEAAFGALIAKGMTAVEAIQALEPGLAQIQEILTATGQQAPATIAALLGFRAVIDQHKELFEVLGGVDDMLTGLANSGLLTQETFAALGTLVGDAFAELTTQGVSAEDALRLMQPQLQKIWELQQDVHFEVDASTQALLDQAAASGVVGDQFRSATDRMVKGIEGLVARMDALLVGIGIKLPDAVDAAGKTVHRVFAGSAVEDAEALGKAIRRSVPEDLTVGVHYQADEPPPLPRGGTGATAVPQAAGGDWVVTSPTLFLAGEAGPERATFAPIGSGASDAGDGGGGYLPVRIELEGLSVAEALVRLFKRQGVQ